MPFQFAIERQRPTQTLFSLCSYKANLDYSGYVDWITLLGTTFLVFSVIALGQEPRPKAVPPVDNDFVQKQFGTTCTLLPGPKPQAADLDGDGVDDVVLIARCTNPLIDQAEHNFQVVDPYNAFFGYGDTKITTQFASEDPQTRGVVLLVIHGTGSAAWRAETPKSKFVIVNLPFKEILLKKLIVKKKPVMAIYAEEAGGDHMTSAIFWDGKKYHYQPLGSGLE